MSKTTLYEAEKHFSKNIFFNVPQKRKSYSVGRTWGWANDKL